MLLSRNILTLSTLISLFSFLPANIIIFVMTFIEEETN